MDKDTFSNASVVTEMSDVLAFSVDTESTAGAPLARRFNVEGLPNLLFLDPDGSARDVISGYLPPEPFLAELARIKRNEGTIAAERKLVEANPDDLGARFALAQRLKSVGDDEGAAAQIEEIKKRDPEGKSSVSRQMAFEEALLQVRADLDPAPLYSLAKAETEPELLFQVWIKIWEVEAYHANDEDSTDPKRAAALARWVVAGRQTWANVSADEAGPFGNSLAWALWIERENISAADKAFALEVAESAVKAGADDPSTIDTYACVLFMNGKQEAAIEAIHKAILLDPENEEWQERLKLFQGKRS